MKHVLNKKNLGIATWLQELNNAITDPLKLLEVLGLEKNHYLRDGIQARHLFPLRVPHTFVKRMVPGDPNDPLLRQVITLQEEFYRAPGFTVDPLGEHHGVIPGLLHKYQNRALILVKTGCAIHCRYCFRRYFPYQKHQGSKKNWLGAVTYVQQHTELNEIILSGGDPLMAKDHELDELISLLENVPHLTTLRIHSRLPIVIPARITAYLCQRLHDCRLRVVMVTHINHPNEIDDSVYQSMSQLREASVTLLNQSVLLHGINDDIHTLALLSETLFSAGILPYYLHLLDKVEGTTHFMIQDAKAKRIMRHLFKKLSGYLVPKLVREIRGAQSKVLVDLKMH